MPNIIGCESANFPSTHLLFPIGCNMSNMDGWKTIIDGFFNKLSRCKVK